MECVLPIKDKSDIEAMYETLREHNQRDYLLFRLAIHTGLRISTLIHLKGLDILTQDEHCQAVINVWRQPGISEINVPLPQSLCEELDEFMKDKGIGHDDYLFRSMKTKRPLSRQQAYRIIHDAAVQNGLSQIGLQSLRKTFAYHAYQSGTPLTVIQKYLGHQTLSETLKFIDVPQQNRTITIQLDL
ncbi:tyrosine-type recombinase/integrase [Staphylococcus simulans]|uniref:tyrosine-type recombinase/integrase n=1 Tax=Staphylococcus simulans TaxID=1286 RepID=UPI00070DC3B4|nr:tyrosine-type recombinase/integrase [Staphylococcus simulans]